jgi:excisionase family DNA binding protein
MTKDDRMLTEQEVAQMLAVSVETLRRWRRDKGGPTWHKIGHAVRYRHSDIEAFLKKARRT